ncbi:hypothetical protein FF38_01311 [Lucilia cuprina]|uniref:Uncharacterized protein n=1 Tax=Lucilia cuprina TaxID=7375 RepID=A0A0L0BX54_LUCCU|nr:hypothetical protein CVS40_10726 [Lucilia cuprina]KNC23814.1 hypothetical protein FF38_01311 [Lucilia cuprina]
MNSKLFDLEHLQQLTYERSKTWASFLDNVAEKETLVEIDINNLEDIFGPECDENDTHEELASMEDDDFEDVPLDADVLRNVTNTTRFSLLFNNKTLALPENANNEEHKLLDIFNQTMPIINEHNRQLKESGFERILSTFDKQKIEDKVGSWLNRHNSLYGGDNTMLYTVPQDKKKDYTRDCPISSATRHAGRAGRSCRNRGTSSKDISHDSDDSLQSGETARYIRSSRAGAIRNAASTTTMIKTYRMVKSTREALREKYACEKAEDECHLKALRHRRKFVNEVEYHHNHYDLARLQKSRKHEMIAPPSSSSSHKERRKVLRKRSYSNSCSAMDSSSDSDYYNDEDHHRRRRNRLPACCNQYHCTPSHNKYTPMTLSKDMVKRFSQRSTIKMNSARMNRMYYYTHSQTKSFSSSSSSSASFSSVCERRRAMKKNGKFYSDNRPCRRESECYCCNERKLCEDYKHVADTSTEEWYVENCISPQKSLKTSASCSKPSMEIEDEVAPIKENVIKTKNSKQTTKDNSKGKSKTIKAKKTSNADNNCKNETFDLELQMAIEASKELYEKEQEMKKNKESCRKEKHEIMPTKPLRKNKKQLEEKEQNQTTRKRQNKNQSLDIDKEDEIVEKLPKLIEVKKELKAELLNPSDDENIFIKPKTVPPKTTTTKNNSSTITTTSTEETFFAPTQTQVICNSTALSSKSKAFNRQITDKMLSLEEASNDETYKNKTATKEIKTKKTKTEKSIKTTKKKATSSTAKDKKLSTKKAAASTTVTSTTIRSPEMNCSLSSTKTAAKEIITEAENDELSDCTLVTSTTNIEPPPQPPAITLEEKLIENSQQEDVTLNTNHQMTHKGILIYAPHNRSMAPAHSFTSDGYFTITKEHLSGVIGEKPAEKFLKYYIGRKRFNSNSTIYFRPPTAASLSGNNISSSSDSDDDLDNLGQYGDLYESLSNVTADVTK